jgi:hypothetical protein
LYEEKTPSAAFANPNPESSGLLVSFEKVIVRSSVVSWSAPERAATSRP